MIEHSDRPGALRRQQAVLQIVQAEPVRSHAELQRRLRQRGIAATQPTLSRDLRELGVAKSPRGYVVPDSTVTPFAPAATREGRLGRTLRASALSVQPAGTLVVIKTPPAGAHPVARALDEAALLEVAGTVAGDDTVLVATSGERQARALARRLAAALGGRARSAGA